MTSEREPPAPLRKRQIAVDASPPGSPPDDGDVGELLDVPRLAQVAYSSEAPGHPVDHLFDGATGPAGSRWVAARTDQPQRLELAFDAPQRITRIRLEAAEDEAARTQEVGVRVSRDGGRTFAELRRQEYTFSPGGATYECEDWVVDLLGVTHLRLDVVPNLRGHGSASLVSLQLYR